MISQLLQPRSVAVVGASDDPRRLRGKLLHVLRRGGYAGAIYPVNPGHPTIQGLQAYPDLDSLPEVPDLVLIALPGALAVEAVAQAARRGAGAAVVYSSGVDAVALRAAMGTSRMRLLGPNTEGLFVAGHRLAATFAHSVEAEADAPPRAPRPERPIAIVSQSGGQGFALFGRGVAQHLDFHSVVATADEGDLDCLDIVEHLVEGGEVGVVLMFIEGLQRPARLAQVLALAAERGVPLVVQKVGKSEAGRRAAVSHTAHLAGEDAAYDALFRRYGVVRVADPEEMLAAAAAFSRLPLIERHRTAIVTTSGGAGAWAAEICAAQGVEIPAFDAALQAKVAAGIPSFGSPVNPVDVTAQAIEDGGVALVGVLALLLGDAQVDAVLVNLGLATKGRIHALRAILAPMLAASAKPVLFHSHILPIDENLHALAALGAHGFPSFRACAFALRSLHAYGCFRRDWPRVSAGLAAAADVPEGDPQDLPDGVLDEARTHALLRRYAIPMPERTLARDAAAARAAARRIGAPVALKIQSPQIAHKSDVGGVALDVAEEQVEACFAQVVERSRQAVAGAVIEGVLVQRMAAPGHEVMVGIVRDAEFGPLVVFGLGGIYVELLNDVAVAPLPIDHGEARRMVERVKASALLAGLRGRPPADVDALVELIVAVARLAAAEQDRIEQLDLNPVLIYDRGQGVMAVDALVVIRNRARPPGKSP